ncbi:MAG: O-antigen ligase family protein [Thermoguttaceae bacterium]|nr:O-antigen ligase family protein [Thermoguttaceae bacterium]
MNVLCLYAAAYPLVAYLFMGGGTRWGTSIVQLFQTLPILALAYLWKFRYKTGSIKSYIEVWTISIVYFTCEAVYFALFYASEKQFSEIVYAARFLSWFWLAATLKRVDLGAKFMERLAKSFWGGAAIQCLLAIWGKFWGLQNGLASPYSNVEATTGSADVSGKTVVAFIVVWIALSVYWALVKRRFKTIYIASVLGGIAVVLFSYNRASQLGLLVAYCVALIACVRKKRFKAAAALGGLAVVGVLVIANYGVGFMTRWETVTSDRGSGRVAMIEIAGKCVSSPPSSGVVWCGRGVYQMQEMMYEEIGSRIGMHNDLLDFAIVYGLIGAALCVWAMYSILNFRKATPKFSIENYFSVSAAVFVVLTGLCTGMFQATYVYFMLISVQHYFISQARLKSYFAARERLINEAAWSDGADAVDSEDFDDFEEFDERDEFDDVAVREDDAYWAKNGGWAAHYD